MNYTIKSAFKGLWYYKWINLLSIITIATCLFIFGLILFGIENSKRFVKTTPEKFSMIVFLKGNLKEKEVSEFLDYLKRIDMVQSFSYKSKQKALEELRKALKEKASILEGIDENPLSPTVTIRIKEKGFNEKNVEKLILNLRKNRYVEDVLYRQSLLRTIYNLYTGTRRVGIVLSVLFSITISFLCYSTVKILFYKRKEEIEIYKLLGATKGFIRAPFVLEGTILGLLGGILSTLVFLSLYVLLQRAGSYTPTVLKMFDFPRWLFLFIPGSGTVLGLIGSFVAIGRMRY